jgi:hypothetical protein
MTSITANTMRLIRNEILEEAARVIDQGQETHSTTAHSDSYHLTPRRRGNLAGLSLCGSNPSIKSGGKPI